MRKVSVALMSLVLVATMSFSSMTVFAGEASDDQTVQEPTAAEVTESSEEAPAEGTVAEDQNMDVQTTENAEETTEEAVEKESNEGVLLKAAESVRFTAELIYRAEKSAERIF